MKRIREKITLKSLKPLKSANFDPLSNEYIVLYRDNTWMYANGAEIVDVLEKNNSKQVNYIVKRGDLYFLEKSIITDVEELNTDEI